MDDKLNRKKTIRRRDLIPIWIKPFIFLFLLLGILALYGIGKNIIGLEHNSSIYGLESYTVFSLTGAFLKIIMLFKAITAFGLWMEKDWAVKFGIIDAALGIFVCIMVMVVLPFVDFEDGVNKLNLRFELFFLIPYLYKMLKIRREWDLLNGISVTPTNSDEIAIEKVFTEESKSEVKEEEKEEETKDVIEEIIDKEDHRRFMPK